MAPEFEFTRAEWRHGSSHSYGDQSTKPRVHSLNHRMKADSKLEAGEGCSCQSPRWYTSSSQAIPSKPPQMVPANNWGPRGLGAFLTQNTTVPFPVQNRYNYISSIRLTHHVSRVCTAGVLYMWLTGLDPSVVRREEELPFWGGEG